MAFDPSAFDKKKSAGFDPAAFDKSKSAPQIDMSQERVDSEGIPWSKAYPLMAAEAGEGALQAGKRVLDFVLNRKNPEPWTTPLSAFASASRALRPEMSTPQNALGSAMNAAPYFVPGAGQALFLGSLGAEINDNPVEAIKGLGQSIAQSATGPFNEAGRERWRQDPIGNALNLLLPVGLATGVAGRVAGRTIPIPNRETIPSAEMTLPLAIMRKAGEAANKQLPYDKMTTGEYPGSIVVEPGGKAIKPIGYRANPVTGGRYVRPGEPFSPWAGKRTEKPIERPPQVKIEEPTETKAPLAEARFKVAAKMNGIRFDGLQQRVNKPPVGTYTDPQTGTTFYVENPANVKARLAEKRAEFEKPGGKGRQPWGDKIPTWDAEWEKLDGVDILRIKDSDYGAVPASGRKDARTFQIFKIGSREPVTQVNKSEVYTWLAKSAKNEGVEPTKLWNREIRKGGESNATQNNRTGSTGTPNVGRSRVVSKTNVRDLKEGERGVKVVAKPNEKVYTKTQDAYLESSLDELAGQDFQPHEIPRIQNDILRNHKRQVASALESGELTPDQAKKLGHFNVYPDLAKKYGPSRINEKTTAKLDRAGVGGKVYPVTEKNRPILEGIRGQLEGGKGFTVESHPYWPDWQYRPEQKLSRGVRKSNMHPAFSKKLVGTQEETINAIDKALSGKPLTDKQYRMIESAHDAIKEFVASQKPEEKFVGDLNLKVGDELKSGGEWYRVIKHEGGELTLKDGRVFKVDEEFAKIPVDVNQMNRPVIRRNVPAENTKLTRQGGDPMAFATEKRKVTPEEIRVMEGRTEPTPAGEQYTIAPKRQVPTTKIRATGKKVKESPINQADLMHPDKIKPGNLPQDQGNLELGALGTPEAYKALGKTVAKIPEKVTPPFLRQARNRIKTPSGQEAVAMIEKADNIQHSKYEGPWSEEMRDAGLRNIKKESEGKRIGDELQKENPTDPVAKNLRVLLRRIHKEANSAGVNVAYREGYLPRRLKADIREQLFDETVRLIDALKAENQADAAVRAALQNRKDYLKEAIQFLVEKRGQSYKEALNTVNYIASQEIFRKTGAEYRRKQQLPSHFYETDVRKIIPEYVREMAQRVAQIEVFGKRASRWTELMQRVMGEDFGESRQLQDLLDMWTGDITAEKGYKGTARKLENMYYGAQMETKIGLGTSVIPNVTQPLISIVPAAGGYRTVKGGLKLLTREGRKLARLSGALNHSALLTFGGVEPTGVFAKISKLSPGSRAFKAVNRFNQYLAASTYEVFAKDLHRMANKPGIRRSWAKAKLEQLKVDPAKPLTREKINEGMYRFATDTQLQRNVLSDPLVFNNPKVRPFFLFKRFGYRQAVWTKDMLKWELSHGNAAPLIRLMVGGVIGGEAVIFAKNKLKSLLAGEPVYREEDWDDWQRYVNDIAAVGSFGVMSDIMGVDKASQAWGAIKFAASPVMVADIEQVYESVDKVLKDLEVRPVGAVVKRQLPEALNTFGSLPRWAKQRIRTDQQKTERSKHFKSLKKTQALDLLLAGKGDEAKRVIQLWNEHNPQNPLTADDINWGELKSRVKMKVRLGHKIP